MDIRLEPRTAAISALDGAEVPGTGLRIDGHRDRRVGADLVEPGTDHRFGDLKNPTRGERLGDPEVIVRLLPVRASMIFGAAPPAPEWWGHPSDPGARYTPV